MIDSLGLNSTNLNGLHVERDFVAAVGRDLFEILIPSFPRIGPQLLRRLSKQKVPRAFDVLGRKRLSVMPLDTLAQPEGQLAAVLAPRPAGGEVRHDRLQAVLRHVLVVNDEIIEHPHHRDDGRNRHFFMDREAGRAFPLMDPKNPARFWANAG